MTSVAPISVARASRAALRSTATIRSQPAARRPAMTRRPMSPVPTTSAEPAPAVGCARHRVQRDGERLRQGGGHHRGPGSQPMDDARRNGDPLGERPVAPPLVGRDAEDATVVAQVRQAVGAEPAPPAVDGAVERDGLARREARDRSADRLDRARRLVAHDQRRDAPARAAVHAVDVAAADPDGLDPDQDVLVADLWLRRVDVLEPPGGREEQGSHRPIIAQRRQRRCGMSAKSLATSRRRPASWRR